MHMSFSELWMAMGPLAKLIVGLLLAMSLGGGRDRDRACDDGARHAAGVAGVSSPRWRRRPRRRARTVPKRARPTIAWSAAICSRTGASLRQHLGLLATIGSTAPFVGLVGTVLGIVNAFGQLAAAGSGGLEHGVGRHRRGARHDGRSASASRSRRCGSSTRSPSASAVCSSSSNAAPSRSPSRRSRESRS